MKQWELTKEVKMLSEVQSDEFTALHLINNLLIDCSGTGGVSSIDNWFTLSLKAENYRIICKLQAKTMLSLSLAAVGVGNEEETQKNPETIVSIYFHSLRFH